MRCSERYSNPMPMCQVFPIDSKLIYRLQMHYERCQEIYHYIPINYIKLLLYIDGIFTFWIYSGSCVIYCLCGGKYILCSCFLFVCVCVSVLFVNNYQCTCIYIYTHTLAAINKYTHANSQTYIYICIKHSFWQLYAIGDDYIL
jgi:hypothetical protein